MRSLFALVLLLLVPALPSEAAKRYGAERFDADIRVLPGGALEVVETVVFRFDEGTFTFVTRDIPTRRTDGIEIVGAEMDGRALAFGTGSGEVEVRGNSPVKVKWRFAPRSHASHTFVLRYIARGVVRRDAGADLLEWHALPTEHDYRIATSRIVLTVPAALAAPVGLDTNRVGDAGAEPGGDRVQILARDIGKNGWVKTRLQFAEGAVIPAPPPWQQRQITATALAPRWITAAAIVGALGLILLFAQRQRYDAPPRDQGTSHGSSDAPPDGLRPALAGALASNGGVQLHHALATLFSLADRGAITITEEPRRWGARQFTLHRGSRTPATAAEEALVLDATFRKKDRDEDEVPLNSARNRVIHQLRAFRKTVQQQLLVDGLLDGDRMRVRGMYQRLALAFFVLAIVLLAPAIGIADTYGPWPFLIPGVAAALAVASLIFYGSLTPLSNEGVRRAERWRSYQRFLKEVARERVQVGTEQSSRLLPFAIAMGLASAWSRYAKHNPGRIPTWFRTMATAGDTSGFPAFIAMGGSGHAGGGSGGGGGAAGGGGSGAG